MDPMDYTFQQEPGTPAQGNNSSLHSHQASWMASQGYLGQVPMPYHPGPFANPFVHHGPVQPSAGFSQPSQPPLQSPYSSPRHSGGAMMGDATHASSQPLSSWPAQAPASATLTPPNLNYGFVGAYDSFGGQPGWHGYMAPISTGFHSYQSPPPAVNTSRHGSVSGSAAARGHHSLPRIETTVSASPANARSHPPQSSGSTFSPSAAPFTPGQGRYQTNPQPSPVSSSRAASVVRAPSYGQYQQYSQSSERNSLDRNNLSSPAPPERSRQRQSRARRSYGARHTASEPFGENISPAAARRPHSMSYVTTVEDANSRHLQLLRGAVTSKMVASKSALRSLQRVDMNDLADNEKCCVICYNDYGVETPEGVSESPLRLPKCRHVFGDFCIKKWLDDSDSCPYCRDKLHSEPKHSTSSARTFMNIMRMRGLDLPARDAEDLYRRILNGDDLELGSIAARSPTGGRRPPPDTAADQQRRTRQRRNSASSDDNTPLTPRNVNVQRQRLPPTPPRLFSETAPESAPPAPAGPQQDAIQQRRIMLEAAASNARASRRRAQDRQTQMANSANGSFASIASDGPLPNPLQRPNGTQPRHTHGSMSEMSFTSTRNYRGNNVTSTYVGQNSVGGSC